MDLDDGFEMAASASITAADLSALGFAEEIGDVRVWSKLMDCYRRDVQSHGTPEALKFFEASEVRLAAAKRHEDEHGEHSLLRLDHAFNIKFRHKSLYVDAAYERYGPNLTPVPA